MSKQNPTEKEKKAEEKKADVFICSRLSQNQAYTLYKKGAANDIPRADRVVHVSGGSDVINGKLDTPHGVVTRITNDEFELLKKNCPAFNRHGERGFLKILKSDPTPKDIKSAADDMPKDKSAQKTAKDIKTEKKDKDKYKK